MLVYRGIHFLPCLVKSNHRKRSPPRGGGGGVPAINVPWLIYVSATTHSCLCRDSSIRDMTDSCVTWLIYIWHASFIRDRTHSYMTWLIHMWHDSFMFVSWLIHTWHDSFICDMLHSCVTWLIHLWQDSFIHDMIYSCVTRLIHVCVVTHGDILTTHSHVYALWAWYDSFI